MDPQPPRDADPTALTNERLSQLEARFQRELAAQKEQQESELKAAADLLETKIKAAADLNDERFRAVGARFADSKSAIDAAFQAATKQTDNQSALIASNDTALRATIGDVKDRVTKLESEERGAKGQQTDTRGTWGMVVGIGGLILALVMAFARFGGIIK